MEFSKLLVVQRTQLLNIKPFAFCTGHLAELSKRTKRKFKKMFPSVTFSQPSSSKNSESENNYRGKLFNKLS